MAAASASGEPSLQAQRWIVERLAERGLALEGPIESIHQRAWSSVWRLPVRAGQVFFKAVGPTLAYEAGLTRWLSHRFPERVTQVLAVEPERGWLLSADGGPRLRDVALTAEDLRPWELLYSSYYQIQQATASCIDELLALKVPDRRLARLPALIEELLDDPVALGNSHLQALTAAERSDFDSLRNLLQERCRQLTEAADIPAALDHGDLHDANVFYRSGRFRIFDWGDASLGHPFMTLRTLSVSLDSRLGLDENSREVAETQRSYMRQWLPDLDDDDLEPIRKLAIQLGPLPAALRWSAALADCSAEQRAPWAHAIPSLLREFMVLVRQ
jgi:hypothetical protein